MQGLTHRQEQVLLFVVRYSLRHLAQPTVRAIGEALGIQSTNGVADHLKALERKGFLLHGSGRGTRRDVGLTRHALRYAMERLPGYEAVLADLLVLWGAAPLAGKEEER